LGVFKDFVVIYGTETCTILLCDQNLAIGADLAWDYFLNFGFQNFAKADLGVKINVCNVSHLNL